MNRVKCLLLGFLVCCCHFMDVEAQDVSVVPYPAGIQMGSGKYGFAESFTVSGDKCFKGLDQLLIEDMQTLYGVRGQKGKGLTSIRFQHVPSLSEEEYELSVGEEGIVLSAASYSGAAMAVTTLLQMVSDERSVPFCQISDRPEYGYRCLMLDVARQWIEPATILQCIDLCRWYKIRYLQLHLSDDQSFTFQSKKYPQLATPGRSYTQKQLKEIVRYASERGVQIIPELDLPGHSSEMRRRMPELFGEESYSVIDIASDKTVAAVKVLMKEIMQIFNTSPYFHIGADECWFGNYETLDHVQAKVEEKGFDGVHDLYLEFIVKMYETVKSFGLQPVAWESFQGNGSRHVKIPSDLKVVAWETAYQTPQSLLEHDYQIVNSSWKPLYVTPGYRWSQEYIYNFNIRRWENHWYTTPAYLKPIQLDGDKGILGGQVCSWEMDDPSQIISLHERMAAASELFWNADKKRPVEDFLVRAASTDDKFMKLIFPADEIRSGFKSECPDGLDNNRINTFSEKGTVRILPLNKKQIVTYTLDGSFPTMDSKVLDQELVLDADQLVKYALYEEQGKLKGYKSVKYKLCPIEAVNIGKTYSPRDRNIEQNKKSFDGKLSVALRNGIPGSEIRYTLDGNRPAPDSEIYAGPIGIEASSTLRALCFVEGRAVGNEYICEYQERDYEDNLAVGKKMYALMEGQEDAVCVQNNYALDGEVDIRHFLDFQGPVSLVVDLERICSLNAMELYTYWDGCRYYQYTVDVSEDGSQWKQIIDKSHNKVVSGPEGDLSIFDTEKARFVRLNMLRNSANPSMHIVELRLYE